MTSITTHPAPPPERPDDAPCALRIRSAAARLFAARGFDGTSMQDVATAAGVSKSNVFHHYRSKNDLYLAVIRAAVEEFGRELAAVEGEAQPFGERFAHLAHAHLNHILADEAVSRLILNEVIESTPDRARELATELFHENFQRIVGMLREAQEAGVVRRGLDPTLAATLLIGANVFYFLSRQVLRHAQGVQFADDPQHYAGQAADVLLNGLLATGDDGCRAQVPKDCP
jgi:TetR/AcrR family transcriptional regulator